MFFSILPLPNPRKWKFLKIGNTRDTRESRVDAVVKDLLQAFGIQDAENISKFRKNIRQICDQLAKRWKESNRTKEKFLKRN